MAYVRQIKTADLTHNDFSKKLLKYVLTTGKDASRIDVVFDVYEENSIKDVKRARRSSGNLVLKKIVPTSQIKQWQQLLSSGDFKNKLISYLVSDWKMFADLPNGKMLIVTDGADAFEITTTSSCLIPELRSNHQEADTRILLHAKHASASYDHVIVATPDTDVFLIALSQISRINVHVYMLTETKDKRRLIDVNACKRFNKTKHTDDKFSTALLGFHAFTGCDTTSAFAGKGIVKPLQLMGKHNQFVKSFLKLGSTFDTTELDFAAFEGFTCHMYGIKDAHGLRISINDVR